MKYLIIGVGGVGGAIASFLLNHGKDVTLAVRSKRYDHIKNRNLEIKSDIIGHKIFSSFKLINIEDTNEIDNNIDEYDIIFVTVKDYSLDSIMNPLLKLCNKDSIVIPLSNVYGTGTKIQKHLINANVIDGCLYIVSYLRENVIVQMGEYFKIIYGKRKNQNLNNHLIKKLDILENDLRESNIDVLYSNCIEKNAYEKYIFISACAATTILYNCDCGTIRTTSKFLKTFSELAKENILLAQKLGINIEDDFIYNVLAILNRVDPKSSTSAKVDWDNGNQTEVDGLIYSIYNKSKELGLKLSTYKIVVKELRKENELRKVKNAKNINN